MFLVSYLICSKVCQYLPDTVDHILSFWASQRTIAVSMFFSLFLETSPIKFLPALPYWTSALSFPQKVKFGGNIDRESPESRTAVSALEWCIEGILFVNYHSFAININMIQINKYRVSIVYLMKCLFNIV